MHYDKLHSLHIPHVYSVQTVYVNSLWKTSQCLHIQSGPEHISSMPVYNYFLDLLLILHHVWLSRFHNNSACQKVEHIEVNLYFSPWEMWRLGCEADSVCSGTSQWHLPSNPPTRQLGSAVGFKQIRGSGGGISTAFSWLTTYQ